MRTRVPLVITFITGFLIILGFWIPHDPVGDIQSTFLIWYAIINGFTMVLGIVSLVHIHTRKIISHKSGYGYSLILILSMLATLWVGLYSGIKYGDLYKIDAPFMWYYNSIFVPLSATMFSLLAFFIASAAYRAFRARTFEATLLLIAGALVMIGRVPIGDVIWHKFPVIADWIMEIPQMAAKRGILIGIALGMIVTSLRIILGIERSYLK